MIPPNANFEQLNPQIDAEFFHLQFPVECVPWPSGDGIRRASVNSFGFGGSNAHVVLEAADYYLTNLAQSRSLSVSLLGPRQQQGAPAKTGAATNGDGPRLANGDYGTNEDPPPPIDSPVDHDGDSAGDKDRRPRLVLLSAFDEDGIERQAKDLSSFAARCRRPGAGDEVLDDIAFTLNSRRTMMEWKSHAVLESMDGLRDLPSSLSKPTRTSPLSRKANIGFVFTGQGAQWPRMGIELLGWPVFRESLTRSQQCLNRIGCQWSLIGKSRLIPSEPTLPFAGQLLTIVRDSR